jgi:hypothetical protein
MASSLPALSDLSNSKAMSFCQDLAMSHNKTVFGSMTKHIPSVQTPNSVA